MFSQAKCFLPGAYSVRTVYGTSRIGKRDIVGHGCNGIPSYKDDAHFPFPSVRFQENSPHLISLRMKEKGDWKLLSCEDKKMLYRSSFCQTFAEFQANTGTWVLILGALFFTTSFGFWAMMFNHFFVANEELPKSLEYENQKAQLRRILELRTNPIDGIASLWNYEEDNWRYLAPNITERETPMAKPSDKL